MGLDIKEFLEHHGVKGQKWGIRHKPSSESGDHASTKHLRGRSTHELSNEELRKANDRLNLEQNYKRLNPGAVSSGKKKAEHILAVVGVGVTAYNVATSPAGKAAINIGKKVLGAPAGVHRLVT